MAYCQNCGVALSASATSCPSCGTGVSSAPPAGKGAGRPLVIVLGVGCGCLGLLFFVGLISAILIPNFIDALQKAKQKRTMADIAEVGGVWSELTMGYAERPEAAGSAEVSLIDSAGPVPPNEILGLLQEHMEIVPLNDGWQHPLEFHVRSDPGAAWQRLIRSPGRDGVFDGDVYQAGSFRATDYDGDVVWADGDFIRWPE
jgi:hypothetical protein